MPFNCEEIPFDLFIGLELTNLINDNLNLPYQIIKSKNFYFFDYIVSNISIEDQIVRQNFPNNTNDKYIFIDDYYSISTNFYKNYFVSKIHNSDLESINKYSNLIINDLNYSNHLSVKNINIYFNNFKNNSEFFLLVQILQKFLINFPERKINFEIHFSFEELNNYIKLLTLFEIFYQNITLDIIIPNNLPDNFEELYKKFSCFDIKSLIVPLSIFINNNENGKPLLSKKHIKIFEYFFEFKVGITFKDDINLIKFNTDNDDNKENINMNLIKLLDYYQYMINIFKYHKNYDIDKYTYITSIYADVIQTPLQPLRDNLQSQSYIAFEEDNIKYIQYEKAISLAIKDLINKNIKFITICLFGGGRGPILRKIIQSLKNNNIDINNMNDIKIKIFCIEKNINAFNTLLKIKNKENIFFNNVTMIYKDMRYFNPKDYNIDSIDICISELLGSFGDNELSPECLKNIEKYMSKNGIMIPYDYTSFLRPVYCPSIWSIIKDYKENFNSPYVIYFKKAYFPIEECKNVFYFKHDLKNLNNFNQYKSIIFNFNKDEIITGFAGYFESVLYKDIKLSINPLNYTNGLYCWFPIYFPSNKHIYIKKGENLIININRINDEKKVWYEWNFDIENNLNGHLSEINNLNGIGYSINL